MDQGFCFSPISHKVNVPFRVDNDAQNVSDLLGALLHTHAVLSQDHTVNITGPVRHKESSAFHVALLCGISLIQYIFTLHVSVASHSLSFESHSGYLVLLLVTRCSVQRSAPSEVRPESLHKCDGNGCRASPAGRSEKEDSCYCPVRSCMSTLTSQLKTLPLHCGVVPLEIGLKTQDRFQRS